MKLAKRKALLSGAVIFIGVFGIVVGVIITECAMSPSCTVLPTQKAVPDNYAARGIVVEKIPCAAIPEYPSSGLCEYKVKQDDGGTINLFTEKSLKKNQYIEFRGRNPAGLYSINREGVSIYANTTNVIILSP
ncbi:MAG: hypothetical protein A2945_02590 [Candidatus Liptonbacteria bacterium RIFCSPLOWO2_01_FULL_52_25]|uniref:Uncharacterized protein n=1 Tax=Candidatus Liptonbacteria bacterium RIFCSPLOWO2_01_FULL_52_25 TaxID=1798650 RepID=A0A1G2CEN3_9BACT|nr:MAG: hypothetical protein A2945_02590 [Candidatus Liptonbacteria bacterium RIFCSPLOWO2_01_FULL_52_25]